MNINNLTKNMIYNSSSTKSPEVRSQTKNELSMVLPGSLHFGEVFTHSTAHCRDDNYTLLTKKKDQHILAEGANDAKHAPMFTPNTAK